ncbi:MAG: ribonuclease III [Candidatus Doudnabacteria bacterium RIFCSPHIGHO2_02_FULL_46_11]|uniref:Ribonuclease 3 n=1 Tax=Candidatus Doudnabacteria bacterium RIFCSPHIGHO2_02_FULL_46_11 TaxID=1817832 RepID=A0A1F5P8S5_9BACT|nr:MAG: ribonuclease III [Candidatus Doudnabacteria bacterium RIFCSPHIGHO2_02_FULL_46_11]
MKRNLDEFEKTLKIKFKDSALLQTSLVHRSYLNEHRDFPLAQNERLEFLGDAVLELVVTDYLYSHYPNPEGELTNFRSALVNHRILSQIAQRLGMGDYILLSRGEAKDTGRARQVILANAIEALIGAIYLDQGYTVAKEFIDREILTELPKILAEGAYLDPKSQLQEYIQEKEGVTPIYQVLSESGPDHAKLFEVGVFINDKMIGQGNGHSKQDAEVSAAQEALKHLAITAG